MSGARSRVFSRRALAMQAATCGGSVLVFSYLLLGDHGLVWSEVAKGVQTVQPIQWVLALVFTAISYFAIGRYDRAIHGWLGTGIDPQAAEAGGRTAIAVSQMTGMGLITGTLMRWYLLPGLSLAGAATVTAVTGATFLAGFLVAASALGLASGVLPPALGIAAWVILGLAASVVLASIVLPRTRLTRHLPSLPRIGTILGLVVVDMGAAAAAFAACLGTANPEVLAGAFIALGAGLASAAPAGLGSADLSFGSLTGASDLATFAAAAAAFRIAYFVVPATIAAAVALIRPPIFRRESAPKPRLAEGWSGDLPEQSAVAPRAEAALILQPGALALCSPMGRLTGCVRRARSSLVAIGDTGLPALKDLARAEGRLPLLYKISPRAASKARRAGWSTRLAGHEAVLSPETFTLQGSRRRQLRRKLRAAEEAGISVLRCPAETCFSDLEQLDAEWSARIGGARGASMGRLDRKATGRQQVFVARKEGRIVAFVSFHATPFEWTLDLVRQGDTAPDGTMHLLVTQAIWAAKQEGVPRLSLAAVPCQPGPAVVSRWFARTSGAQGLRQFKACFADRFIPVYTAAPGPLALALGLADIAREITAKPA